jgi:hypothetical protein
MASSSHTELTRLVEFCRLHEVVPDGCDVLVKKCMSSLLCSSTRGSVAENFDVSWRGCESGNARIWGTGRVSGHNHSLVEVTIPLGDLEEMKEKAGPELGEREGDEMEMKSKRNEERESISLSTLPCLKWEVAVNSEQLVFRPMSQEEELLRERRREVSTGITSFTISSHTQTSNDNHLTSLSTQSMTDGERIYLPTSTEIYCYPLTSNCKQQSRDTITPAPSTPITPPTTPPALTPTPSPPSLAHFLCASKSIIDMKLSPDSRVIAFVNEGELYAFPAFSFLTSPLPQRLLHRPHSTVTCAVADFLMQVGFVVMLCVMKIKIKMKEKDERER